MMKSISFALDMPHDTAYVGGIAFIVNQYLANEQVFAEHGYKVDLIDYSKCNIKKNILPSKIRNFVDIQRQKKMLENYVSCNPDTIIHMHTSIGWTLFKDLVIADAIKRKHNNKLVLSIHFAELPKILSHIGFIRKFELNVLKSCFDKIIFLSQKTRDEFVECGIEKNKTEVLYTFHTYQDVSSDLSKKNDKLVLLFMGSIDKRKGIIDLLTALNQMRKKSFHLHICGQINDSSVKEEYMHLLDELSNKVTFHGYVTGQEKEKLFEESDIFILPSYGEGMPIVIMEAMTKGCAIISTEVGAIGEIVNKENGILIQPGDIDALKAAITMYMYNGADLEATKQVNRRYGSRFNLESNIKTLTDIYSKV